MLKEETNNNNINNNSHNSNNINNETPIIQATVIEPIPNRISVVSTSESDLHVDNTMKLTYSLAKTLKFLCAIDIFFSFIYCFYEPFMFIPLLCAISGYYGAKKYKVRYINIYTVYQIIVIILRTALLIYTSTIVTPAYSEIIFFILNQIVAIWTLQIIRRLYKSLMSLTENQVNLLRNIGYIPTARVVYY